MPEIILTKLQPGQKYAVQVIAKDENGQLSEPSHVLTFTTPDTSITASNSVVKQYLYDTAGIYAASNMFMNSEGIFAYLPDQDLSPETRTVWIDANTGDAYFAGTIFAQSGSIGGYFIGPDSLYGGSGNSFVGLSTTGTYSIFAGATASTGTGALFSVTPSGNLTATNANISGSINATSGSIGGFLINNNNLANTASTIVLSSITGLTLGSASQFRVDLFGNLVAQTASIVGNINAQSGSITGDLSISSAGRLIAGNLGTNVVIVSGAGITGAQNGIPTFTLPSDGTPPTIGGFQVVQTGLVGYGETTIYPVSGTASNTLTMAASAASTLWIGMSASGPNTPSALLITQINTTTGVVTLSGNNTASFTNGSVTFTPNANLVVGTSASNNIVIRGQNAPGLPPAIFTRINNVATTDSAGTGFYVGQDGKVNIGNKLKWDGSLLSVDGSGSFSGSITASAGYIGGTSGWTIGSASLTGGTSGSTVGLLVPATNGAVSIFAGGATPSSAPFRVTNTGSLVASSASITGRIVASSGSIANWAIVAGGISYTDAAFGNGSLLITLQSTETNVIYPYTTYLTSSSIISYDRVLAATTASVGSASNYPLTWHKTGASVTGHSLESFVEIFGIVPKAYITETGNTTTYSYSSGSYTGIALSNRATGVTTRSYVLTDNNGNMTIAPRAGSGSVMIDGELMNVAYGNGTTSSAGNLTVTFPSGRFTNVPTVVVSPRDNTSGTAIRNVYSGNVTVSSFTVFATNGTSIVAAPFSWIAIGI